MAEYTTPAPKLESFKRLGNGVLEYSWENKATSHTSYTKIYLFMRKAGGGNWSQGNAFGYPTISNRKALQRNRPAAYGGGPVPFNEQWQIMLRAYSPGGGVSPDSNIMTVNAESTKPPVIGNATRLSQSAVRIQFDQMPAGQPYPAAVYAYMREVGSGSSFVQVNRTTSTSQKHLDISKFRGTSLNGSKAYEIELMASGPAGTSNRTSRKTVPAWWVIPTGVTNLQGEWDGNNVKLTWGGTPTASGPYDTQEVHRADGTLGQFRRITTIAGNKRDYTDTSADPSKQYRYQIIPKSPAGLATQKPDVRVDAKLQTPIAPTNVEVEYLATDKVKVTWVRKDTVDRPYANQRLLVREEGSTEWIPEPKISGAAITNNLSIGPNKVVEVAVEAINVAGSTTSSPSDRVATTPARPASLEAFWSSDDTITIRWPDVSTIADKFVLEFSSDETTWYPAPVEDDLPPEGGSWPHQTLNPSGGKYYHLKAVKPSIPGTPDSSWVSSVLVVPLTIPNPPTPIPPEIVDAREAIRLAFTHNSVDGSPQTGAKVRFRKQGVGAWTIRTLTTSDFTTITAGTYANGDTLEMQAQTAGSTGEYSDWSEPTMLVVLRERPEVLSLTTSPLTSQTVTGSWTASSQSSALVELLDGSLVVEARTVGAGIRNATWASLQDQTTYTMRVTVRDQWQDSLPRTVSMPIVLVRPGKPTATAEFRLKAGDVLVTGVAGADTETMEVWRDDPEEPFFVGKMVSGSLEDPFPPLGRPSVLYWVRARGSAGGFIDSNVVSVSTAQACDVYLSFSGGTARGGWDPQLGGTAGRVSVPLRYVGDVEGPSFSYGQKNPRVVTAVVTIDERTGDSPLRDWVTASEEGEVVYRDPSGRVHQGAMTEFSFVDSSAEEQLVSFKVTQGRKIKKSLPRGHAPAPQRGISSVDFADMFLRGIGIV